MPSSGLVGVSHQMHAWWWARIAARTASRSCSGTGGVLDAPAAKHPSDQPERAAVGVAGQDHVVARAADGAQQGVLGGQAAGEGQPARTALERGQASSSAVRVGLALRLYS